jgi:hypothetical protein
LDAGIVRRSVAPNAFGERRHFVGSRDASAHRLCHGNSGMAPQRFAIVRAALHAQETADELLEFGVVRKKEGRPHRFDQCGRRQNRLRLFVTQRLDKFVK